VWEKAIKARAFDIMRSFLPSGAVILDSKGFSAGN
jgi:hypothetical protein